MCPKEINISIRRYTVPGAQKLSNYWWATFALIGGFGFLIVGLYSYYVNFYLFSESSGCIENLNTNFEIFSFFKNIFYSGLAAIKNESIQPKPSYATSCIDKNFQILFFPQGLSMCFYGLFGILFGTYLWLCILFQIGSGFTEFNKETGNVKIFRLGFPGQKRIINYTYTLTSIQCICVKIAAGFAPVSQRGIYMRLKLSENQIRDIPLELYSEKTSLENIELQAADLSKFLRVSLSIF